MRVPAVRRQIGGPTMQREIAEVEADALHVRQII